MKDETFYWNDLSFVSPIYFPAHKDTLLIDSQFAFPLTDQKQIVKKNKMLF